MTTTTTCPVCDGAIHQVAGRCKHCKTDLVQLREQAEEQARAAAMAQLPADPEPPRGLSPNPQFATPSAHVPPPQIPAAEPGAKGHTAPAPVPVPMRTHGSAATARAARRPGTWANRWPLIVSAIALFAIGVSVGVLAERWRSNSGDEAVEVRRESSTTPHRIPDRMPAPMTPEPDHPRGTPEPSIPSSPDPL